jgi:hypothetical protein
VSRGEYRCFSMIVTRNGGLQQSGWHRAAGCMEVHEQQAPHVANWMHDSALLTR